MTTHDRDKIIAAAKGAGFNYYGDYPDIYQGRIDALYAIAFESGRQAEREECANVCESIDSLASSNPPMLCAKAIRARGEVK